VEHAGWLIMPYAIQVATIFHKNPDAYSVRGEEAPGVHCGRLQLMPGQAARIIQVTEVDGWMLL